MFEGFLAGSVGVNKTAQKELEDDEIKRLTKVEEKSREVHQKFVDQILLSDVANLRVVFLF